jgi:MFS transporter, SHS family, sialic acid transporter
MTTAPVSRSAKWLALTAALLGWAFDGMEMGLFPRVARPALQELLAKSAHVSEVSELEVNRWYGIATAGFLVGAATGGVLFGWLGDRLGRVRALTLSVLTYTVITGLCALAGEAWHLVVLRFTAALGMGGEWSLGVALVNEIWPGQSRAFLAGLIGAAANVGFFLAGAMSPILHAMDVASLMEHLGLAEESRRHLLSHDSWRLLLLVGALPAVLCLFIRLFVPESQRWEQERQRGATSHWATRDLLGVLIGSAGASGIIFLWAVDNLQLGWQIAGTLAGFAVAVAGFVYPVMRYLGRAEMAELPAEHRTWPTIQRMLFGAALSGVALVVTWGTVQPVVIYAARLVKEEHKAANVSPGTDTAIATTQMWSALGAIVFSILAALFGNLVGRRVCFALLCLLSLASVFYCYQVNHGYGAGFLLAVFLMGGLCSTFYGWLPLYLPELFRTSVRATGQGFCYNFGRILAAIVVLQLGNIFKEMESSPNAGDGQPAACTIIGLAYIVGMVIIWFAPETKGRPLPE